MQATSSPNGFSFQPRLYFVISVADLRSKLKQSKLGRIRRKKQRFCLVKRTIHWQAASNLRKPLVDRLKQSLIHVVGNSKYPALASALKGATYATSYQLNT